MNFKDATSGKDIERIFNEAGIDHMLNMISYTVEDDNDGDDSDDENERQRSNSKFSHLRLKKNQTALIIAEKKILVIYDNIDHFSSSSSFFKWHVHHMVKKYPHITLVFTRKSQHKLMVENSFGIRLQPLSSADSVKLIKLYSLRQITANDFEP